MIEDVDPLALPNGSEGTLFLTPKSSGTHSRAIYDARHQNSKINWCRVSEHGRFKILRPYHQILVGLATGASTRPMIAEIDFKSFFFQFSWSSSLADAHAFRIRQKYFRCVAPVQGSALMPLAAQTASAILAEAPSIRAGPWEWVRAGTNLIYDNILISGEAEVVSRRWSRLIARCKAANAILGDTHSPRTTLVSCGLEYDVTAPDNRRWRLAPAWCKKTADWLRVEFRATRTRDREVLAGLAQWALGACLLPLAFMRRTIEGFNAEDEKDYLKTLLEAQTWRRLRGTPSETTPTHATVVVTDGSVHGAGVVLGGNELAVPWLRRRCMQDQQNAEWDAADLGIGHAIRETASGDPILYVSDNTGVLAGLMTGNPTSLRGVEVVRRLHATLRGPLWVAFVASEDNPADRPSRSPAGKRQTPTWPHPLEGRWRARAVLATWSMSDPTPSS